VILHCAVFHTVAPKDILRPKDKKTGRVQPTPRAKKAETQRKSLPGIEKTNCCILVHKLLQFFECKQLVVKPKFSDKNLGGGK